MKNLQVTIKETYPIAGDIKKMGAVTNNGANVEIYYKDGYCSCYGFPKKVKMNSRGTAVIGISCIYEITCN